MLKIYKLLILVIIIIFMILVYGWVRGWFDDTRISTLEFIKDSMADTKTPGESVNWRTFQIAEIALFDKNDIRLDQNAFAKSEYDDASARRPLAIANKPTNAYDGNLKTHSYTDGEHALQTLKITLAKPVALAKISIYNRTDLAAGTPAINRLAGVKLIMRSADGKVRATKTLSGSMVQSYTL